MVCRLLYNNHSIFSCVFRIKVLLLLRCSFHMILSLVTLHLKYFDWHVRCIVHVQLQVAIYSVANARVFSITESWLFKQREVQLWPLFNVQPCLHLDSLPFFEGFIHMRKVTSLWKICICSFLKAKLLGMGWKRDSNPFNGPKWENCCNRDLFGHLKVKCSVNNPVHFIWRHH